MPRDQYAITSYHEAGHVVMAMANGFRVTEMSSVANDERHGHVSWQVPITLLTTGRIGSVLVFAAGMAADFIHWEQSSFKDADELCMGHQDDRHQAEIHLRELGDDGRFDDYLAFAIWFLRKIEIWKWVEFFASLMQMVETINGQEVIDRAFQMLPKIGKPEIDALRLMMNHKS